MSRKNRRKEDGGRRMKPSPGSPHVTLAMCVLRAEVAREWSLNTLVDALKVRPTSMDHVEAMIGLRPAPGTRASFAFQLYMGSLFVAAEAWKRFGFDDPEINELLRDEESIAMLRECRDKVFHAGDAGDPIRAFHPAHCAESSWGPKLHLALVRYCREHFKGFGEADREKIRQSLATEDERRRQAGYDPDLIAPDPQA